MFFLNKILVDPLHHLFVVIFPGFDVLARNETFLNEGDVTGEFEPVFRRFGPIMFAIFGSGHLEDLFNLVFSKIAIGFETPLKLSDLAKHFVKFQDLFAIQSGLNQFDGCFDEISLKPVSVFWRVFDHRWVNIWESQQIVVALLHEVGVKSFLSGREIIVLLDFTAFGK